MKIHSLLRRASLAAAMTLLAMGGASRSTAATALNARLYSRPLTSIDIATYQLPSNSDLSGGLTTVGVGVPVYLEADLNNLIPGSDITGVIWSLTSRPIGSAAVLTNCPFGTNVPVYEPSDRLVSQVAGRMLLRPDMSGSYTVTATITTATEGTTNLTLNITAGTYMGVNTCALCHSGGQVAPNKVVPWSQTLHARIFSDQIDGLLGNHMTASCLKCHTTGYESDPLAINGGFDDIATQLGWTIPTLLTNGNWANMQSNSPTLANLANVQCEMCHGPGSQHAYSLGNTNLISVTYSADVCQRCHDDAKYHPYGTEWLNSKHAIATRIPSGPGRAACARCHTAGGFEGYTDALASGTTYTTNNADTTYTSINCTTCHDPHDPTNPHQLRAGPTVLLADGVTTVTNAGLGGFCMNCHRARNGSVTNSIVQYPLGQQTWAGGTSFGPHDNPASDMLEGVNGWTYGKIIPSSAHALSVTNTCVGCHMQEVASTDPAFLQAGGHTWNMTYTNSAGVTLDKVDVCIQCHGQISSFDMVKEDYNGDGVIEGVQTEVQHLLDQLSTMLPSKTYVASGSYVPDGLVKTSISTQTNWPARYLEAAYNWQFVNNDRSKGVHNAAYAVGLLKASIADLTGDANNDGLPDSWQSLYFGSATNSSAAPNACPAGDGIPNWLKYALGLNPTVAGAPLPDGVVWANAATDSNGSTNTIQIYTAAEITFNTQVGVTYQLQAISSLSASWQNVGQPVTGTGEAYSFLTPTRNDKQQYFRVVHTP